MSQRDRANLDTAVTGWKKGDGGGIRRELGEHFGGNTITADVKTNRPWEFVLGDLVILMTFDVLKANLHRQFVERSKNLQFEISLGEQSPSQVRVRESETSVKTFDETFATSDMRH